MTPTDQQLACIQACINNTKVKIGACAGSGKTSTLTMIANSLLEPSLYMAFNKVTAEEALTKFPKHVTCKTTHSLAFAQYGKQLMDKLSRPKGKYVNVGGTGSEIARLYSLDGVYLDGVQVVSANAIGLYVRRTVERFEQSADNSLAVKHVPSKEMEKVIVIEPTIVAYTLKWAKKLWADRINVNKSTLAGHDTYLKLYQLSKPTLPYKVLYVDEAQDSNPCVLDIINNQKQAKVVLVGDRRQAIYGWRGATNAMASVNCVEAPLSKSFRYGQGIADVATAVLHNDMVITGREDLSSIVGFNVVDRAKPYMYLFRTNALLLLEAVSAIDKGAKVKVEIDTKDFVKLLQSAVALYQGLMKDVKHEGILPYSTWYALCVEAKEQGGELNRIVGIVAQGQAAHIVSVLEHYTAPMDATATYTTAHKAKGRECDQVILADDFPTNYNKGAWKGLPESEENLLYVAVTRSQRMLEINQSVREVLDKYHIKYINEQLEDKCALV